MKPELKLAKLQDKQKEREALIDLAVKLAGNPIIEIVGGFALIELGQRYPKDKPLFTGFQGNLMQAGLGGIITAQQLAPIMPQLLQGGASLTKLLPML